MSFYHNSTEGKHLWSLFNLGCLTVTHGIMYFWWDIVKHPFALFNIQSWWLQCYTYSYPWLYCNPTCLYYVMHHHFVNFSSFRPLFVLFSFFSSFHLVISLKILIHMWRFVMFFHFIIFPFSYLSHLSQHSYHYFIFLSYFNTTFEFSQNLIF
jgi:hypothetical protein